MKRIVITLIVALSHLAEASSQLPEVARLLGNDQAVTSLSLCEQDQRTLVVADQKNQIIAWDIATRRQLWKKTTPKRTYAMAFTRDGSQVVVGGRYQMLRTYDVASGQLLTEFEQSPERHRTVHQLARFTSGYRYLLTVATIGDELTNAHGHYPELHESERQRLRTPSTQSYFLWNAESGKLLNRTSLGDDSTIISLGLSADETRFYTVSATHVTIRELESGQLTRRFPVEDFSAQTSSPVILAAAFDSTMRALALSTLEGVVVLQSESGRVMRKLPIPGELRPNALQFSLNGSELYGTIAGAFSRVLSWDVLRGQVIFDEPLNQDPSGRVQSEYTISTYSLGPLVVFSPEQQLLVHAFTGEFGASGAVRPGGTGVIIRKLHAMNSR